MSNFLKGLEKETDRNNELIDQGYDDLIVNINVDITLRGHYKTKSKLPKGLVVHTTGGHDNRGSSNATDALKHLCSKGYGCMSMDLQGNIYKSTYQNWNQVAYHAGSSKWMGKSGLSRYCMGIEICNPGKLIEYQGEYYPYWSFKTNGKLRSSNVYAIEKSEIRFVDNLDNMKSGAYKKMSEAQEASLIDFINWQVDVNPEFDLDWVVGHDEVSPSRKTDPGGSLSQTMPEFREFLKAQNGN